MNAYDQTLEAQRIAAHPARSAFVMANAGAGKTHLLISRVARLLLTKIQPAKILCITFTKAAAAEMSERLFKVLGDWTLSDDETLQDALNQLEGKDAHLRDAQELAVVRRLFAQALETPGGLKIQTIHAFCESTLRRFPLEAGVAPGFTVLEDGSAGLMLDDALSRVAADALDDNALASAFARLTSTRNERDLRTLLINAAQRSAELENMFAQKGGLDGVVGAIAAELDADPAKNDGEIKREFIAALSRSKLHAAQGALAASGKNAQKRCALPLQTFLNALSPEDQWAWLLKLFFKSNGEPRGAYGDKSTEKAAPWVDEYLIDIEQQFVSAHETAKAAVLLHDTVAYLNLLSALSEKYRAAKAAEAALDFDDLIVGAQRLFVSADAAWIMYKLDQGIDHILIDEAQDTSPGQWAVIEAPLKEFFSGAGAREAGRTFFAVGDIKQSIYSFQGADAGLFTEKEDRLGRQISAVADYKNVELTLSFRTTTPVLSFVDALFADPEAAEGLGGFPVPKHDTVRTGHAGLVELWPLTPRPETEKPDPWDAPVDASPADHPVEILCARIADTIDDWLRHKEILASKNRAIEPDDIMVLVQSRGRLFDEIIRSLARAGVPVAGADRLKLLEDPSIEDLLSFARAALTPDDDLSLAETLKSPFFGFDDEALFDLAYPRPEGHSLWNALIAHAGNHENWAATCDAVQRARAIAKHDGPVSFFSHILEGETPSGRSALYARLSRAARDAVDELLRQALQFENANPRSLRSFVHWFENNAGEIKREMERESGAVRVMTVHGAKGLESNIVFLLDAQRGVNLQSIGPIIELERDPVHHERAGRLPILTGSKDRDTLVMREARGEKIRKAYEEYRRLLYVAATRARDRLYICGVEMGNNKNPGAKEKRLKSWHSLAQDAFQRLESETEAGDKPAWPGGDEPVLRLSSKQTAEPEGGEPAPAAIIGETPHWLHKPAPAERASQWLTPSALTAQHSPGDGDAVDAHTEEGPAYSPSGSYGRYFRGRTLHRLLELLPDLPDQKRRAGADQLLQRLAPGIDKKDRASWRDEVLAILEDPAFAAVFAPGSRAEVSIAGAPKGAPAGSTFSGQIDRLAVSDRKILVVDYKTNRPPPAEIDEADPNYIVQMAAYRALLQEIYPDHEIDCALLWTYDARLMPVPATLMDHAFARYMTAG